MSGEPALPLAVAAAWSLGLGAALALAVGRPAAILAHGRLVLGLIAALSLAAAAALVRVDPLGLRLRIDPSTEPLLPPHDPARALYEEAVRDFGEDEVFVIALVADDVFTREALSALRRVTDAVARLPGVRRVQSLTDVVSFHHEAEGDALVVRPFLEEIPEDPAALAALRARALADPLYRRSLVSDDARGAALNVTFRKMSDGEFIASGLDAAIGAVLDRETGPGLRFHVAGRPHVKATVYRMMLRDLALLVPGALAAMAAVLALVGGTVRGVLLPLASVAIATLWTFATLACLGRPLNLLTSLLAPTLISIGSVYGVHVVARFEEEAQRGDGPRAAALRCLVHLRLPVLVAGATTVIGFAALLVTDVPAVFELGAFSALGLGIVTVLSLTALPVLLARARPASAPSPLARRLGERIDGWLVRAGRGGGRHPGPVLALAGALAVLAALLLPRIVIDTDYLSYFDPRHPLRRDFDAVNGLLAGVVPLYVPLHAPAPGAFRSPDLLRALERLEGEAERLSGVSHAESMVDTLRVLNRALSGDDPAEERLPESRAAVAELLFLAPKGHLERFTNVNHSRANLVVRTGAVGTAATLELEARLARLLADHGLPEGVTAGVTGNAILLARSADAIARSQPRSVGLAALAILALVTTSLGSLRLGAVAMVPNALPVLLFFGLLGAGVAPLSLPTSLIGSVALGIAIDDTVHLLVRYREERHRGLDPEAAIVLATRRVGRPIAITNAMLVTGFAVIALSSFATLSEFGWLSALTMGICLATDLLLLPALVVGTRA
jgi:hypothetical protein